MTKGRQAVPDDGDEIVVAEGPVAQQVGFGHRPGQQALELRLGERTPSRHGRVSLLR
jgi:hypothetical protein